MLGRHGNQILEEGNIQFQKHKDQEQITHPAFLFPGWSTTRAVESQIALFYKGAIDPQKRKKQLEELSRVLSQVASERNLRCVICNCKCPVGDDCTCLENGHDHLSVASQRNLTCVICKCKCPVGDDCTCLENGHDHISSSSQRNLRCVICNCTCPVGDDCSCLAQGHNHTSVSSQFKLGCVLCGCKCPQIDQCACEDHDHCTHHLSATTLNPHNPFHLADQHLVTHWSVKDMKKIVERGCGFTYGSKTGMNRMNLLRKIEDGGLMNYFYHCKPTYGHQSVTFTPGCPFCI